MSDNPAPAADPTPEPPKPTAPATPADAGKRDAADEPLGEAGLKALHKERTERERLERELRPLKEQMDALRGVFGPKDGTTGSNEDIVKTLQQQMEQMQRDGLVNTVARRHGITADSDIAFLRTAPDEQAMTSLAERLKTPPPPNSPAPDPSQGAQPLTPEAAAEAEYAAFFPTRT